MSLTGFSDTVTVFPERRNPSAPPLREGTAVCVFSATPLTNTPREAPATRDDLPPCQPMTEGFAVRVTDQPP